MKLLTLCAILVISSSCAERRVCKTITLERLSLLETGTKLAESPPALVVEADVCYNE